MDFSFSSEDSQETNQKKDFNIEQNEDHEERKINIPENQAQKQQPVSIESSQQNLKLSKVDQLDLMLKQIENIEDFKKILLNIPREKIQNDEQLKKDQLCQASVINNPKSENFKGIQASYEQLVNLSQIPKENQNKESQQSKKVKQLNQEFERIPNERNQSQGQQNFNNLSRIQNKSNLKESNIEDCNSIINELNQQNNNNSNQDFENNEDFIQKFNVEEINKLIAQIPYSSEKILIQITNQCLICLKAYSDLGKQQILGYLQETKNRLNVEELLTQDIEDNLLKIKSYINSNDLRKAVIETEILLKKIRPLNIYELKKLIIEAKQGSELVKDQEILLFLGQTGTGKSTTIHFLSGSKMVQLKSQVAQGSFLPYIGPDPNQIKNEDLKRVKIGFRYQSETRHITPIYVKNRDVGIDKDGFYILCDSAGFGDTGGAEVDISNGIGIVEAVKKCKSVRPVILVSSISVGEKGQGIKELANILVGLVNNIKDYMRSFSYLFTKYSPEIDIHASLVSIRDSLSSDECSNPDFISLFEDMIDKAEINDLKIDPLKDKPSKLIKKLLQQNPLNNPKRVFQFSITENSKNVLLEQVRINQICIISAIKRQEYELIQYKLDDLAYLIEILNQDFTKKIYSDCINFVKQHLNKSYEDAVEQLKRCIKNSNKLDTDDLIEFKQLVARFEKVENLRKLHLGNDVVQTSSLIQALKEAVQNMSKSFNDGSDIKNSETINNLDNIKLIASHFSEIKHQYKQLCQLITQKIQKISSSCDEALENQNFSKLAAILSQIKQYSNLYKNHLNEQEIIAQFNKIVQQFTAFIKKICLDADQILLKTKRSDEDIKELNSIVNIIESAEQTLELKQHILAEVENIKQSKQNIIKKAIQLFETYNSKIEQVLKEENHENNQLEELFFQMGLIKNIKGLDNHIGEAYHKSVQEIVGLMNQKNREVVQFLSDFRLDKRKVDFDKIMRCINWLKHVQWMNSVKSGTYDSTIKSISEELVKYCNQQILEKLIDLDLNQNHPENIQIASDLITEIDNMRSFENHNNQLANIRNLANEKFKASPQKVFDFINNQFKISNSDSEESGQSLNQFQSKLDGKNLETLLNYLDACHKSRWLRDDANSSKLVLTEFLQQYGQIKQQEMLESFENIKNVTQNEIKTVPGNAFKLSLILKQFLELEAYPQTFEIIKGQHIMFEWRNNLHQYYIELNEEMSNPCISNQNLTLKICISRALASVDFVLGENNMFQNNYKQFQVVVTHEFREVHKRILQFIEKNDFQSVQVEIALIDESPINDKAFNQIKQQINQQINFLFEEAKKTVVTLGSILEKTTILQIVENLNKINSAKKYLSSLQGILDLEKFNLIEEQIEQIKVTISKKIYQNLESIQALIKKGCFFEAEQKKEHINQIQHILGFYAQDNEMINKLEKVQNDLFESIETTVQSYYNDDSDLVLHPPKQILDELSKLSGNNLKYEECYRLLQKRMITKARSAIKDYHDSCPEEKNQWAIKVENFLTYLPDDLKLMLSNEFNNQKSLFLQKEEGYENNFKRVVESNSLEQKKKFLDKCIQDKMIYFQDKISKEILTEAKQLRQQFKDLLAEANISQAILQLNELFQIKNLFGQDILGLEVIIKEVKDITKTQILKILKYLKTIESAEVEQFEIEYNKLLTFIFSFNNSSKQSQEIFNKEIYQTFDETFYIIQKFLISNQQNFDKSLSDYDIYNIEKNLLLLKRWENLRKIFSDLDEFSSLNQNQVWLKSMIQIAENCCPYYQSIQKVQVMLENVLKEILSFSFRDQQQIRNNFYQTLYQKLKIMKNVQAIKGSLSDTLFDLEAYNNYCKSHVFSIIENGLKQIEKILNKNQLQRNDFDMFNFIYLNIDYFEQNVKIQDFNTAKFADYIEEQLKQKIKTLGNKIINGENIGIIIEGLIQMKSFSENIPSFKTFIDKTMDEYLKRYLDKDILSRGQKICDLTLYLLKEETGLGESIIADHACFKGQSYCMFNKTTQRHGIEYITSHIKGDLIDKQRIQDLHKQIKDENEELVIKYLTMLKKQNKNEIIQDIVLKIKQFQRGVKHKNGKITWDYQIKEKLPSMIAQLFALYTLMNSEYYQEVNDNNNYKDSQFQPHSGQIVSILRLLGLGYGDKSDQNCLEKLQNNLIQIGTGEGKSITLAITSSIFALSGVDVYCACYSEDLSQRDYQSFLNFFETLGITDKIKYGPFNKVCELQINEQGDIRKLALDFIKNGFTAENSYKLKETSQIPKILLIDEVDIFFSSEFYGNLYIPQARLSDKTIQDLALLIWKNRQNNISLEFIQGSSEYQECIKKFKNLNYIIDESIKDMIADSNNFSHEYWVINDKIAYKEQDGISFDVTYGYKTLFAYFYENNKGKISQKSLEENCFIGIKCGSFSYAEIPLKFEYIVGVTGTLQTLTEPELNIIKKEYNINTFTYIPSVFGQNKRKFAEKYDVYVENSDDYYKILREQIDNNLTRNNQKRAVLVFFETKNKLMNFYNSPEVQSIKQNIQIITEEVVCTQKEKSLLIKRATQSGQISFLTASFGRGTDFICRDQQVLKNGGVHIIQAFYSSKKSEETQIMGRTARQQADGSYSMVLLDSDLEFVLGASYREKIKEMRDNNNFYIKLDQSRKELQNISFQNSNKFIELVRKEHEKGQQFIQSIINQNEDQVKKFLQEQNKGANLLQQQSRILILVDATSSMGVLLQSAKNTVFNMFDRACQIIRNNKIPDDSFKIQFVVYRDYDQMQEGILQSSPWESKAENIRKFLNEIQPIGGGDYEEAVEVGLQHANYENSVYPISQIILIADAPSKNQHQIKQYRQKFGGESYWQKTKYSQITDYLAEIKKLKNSKIPVNCFYLNKGAQKNFQYIADFTGGKCQALDINKPDSSEILTHIIVEPILESVGQKNGKGDNLVKDYKKLFNKSYK
ncbi:hypothetical protein ABPG74_014508 [Tetrahymena malaccensis]